MQSTIGRLKGEKNDQQESGGLDPDSGPVGQDDRPMFNWEIGR
jgi:hypothetical protein